MKRTPLFLVVFIGVYLCYHNFQSLGTSISMSWDSFGYYYYLPLFFLQASILIESLSQLDPIFETYNPSSSVYQFTLTETGNYIIRYPIGQAILYLPFFIIGHLCALLFDYPTDGFSLPYDFAMRIGGLAYHSLSFYLIGRLLLNFFKLNVVVLTVLVLFLGTNIFCSLNYPLIAHGSLLFLISILLLFCQQSIQNEVSHRDSECFWFDLPLSTH